MNFELHHGDCLEVLRGMADNSVDSIVTDPPYGLTANKKGGTGVASVTLENPYGRARIGVGNGAGGFMGLKWDSDVPPVEVWAECLRVLKPGGHLLAFAGTRTQHRMAVRIEDAGFEIRDMIAWVYGSGFPKSLDVSKAIDKAAGRIGQSVIELKQRLVELAACSGKTRAEIDAECGFRATNYLTLPADGNRPDPWVNCLPPRDKWLVMKRVLGADDSLDEVFTHAEREVVGTKKAAPGVAFSSEGPTELDITAPATDAARQWQGWGTALKPALEPITVARKPLVGTVADNVLQHGTGALNIDGCRVAVDPEADASQLRTMNRGVRSAGEGWGMSTVQGDKPQVVRSEGRWPANLIHDGSDEVLAAFPQAPGQSGAVTGREPSSKTRNTFGLYNELPEAKPRGDTGSAARFFYCAKASRADRNAGLPSGDTPAVGTAATMRDREDADWKARNGNHHPTVKPTDLMAYLCRLVTPPGGVVLDPFMGSGSTGKAAMREGFRFVGIEREAEYLEIARARITAEVIALTEQSSKASEQPDLFVEAA